MEKRKKFNKVTTSDQSIILSGFTRYLLIILNMLLIVEELFFNANVLWFSISIIIIITNFCLSRLKSKSRYQ